MIPLDRFFVLSVVLFGTSLLLGCSSPIRSTSPTSQQCSPLRLDENIFTRRLVILGEIHGTQEAPAFVEALTCHFEKRGRNVVLALELPVDTLERVRTVSRGTVEKKALGVIPFWKTDSPDGKTSVGMWQLLSAQLEREVLEGSRSKLYFFDTAADSNLRGAQRETAMAANLEALLSRQAETSTVLVLTGNLHSRKERGVPWNKDFEPLAFLLRQHLPVTFDLAHLGGTAWTCSRTACDARAMKATHEAASFIHGSGFYRDHSTNAHDGWFFVGTLSASPPLLQMK